MHYNINNTIHGESFNLLHIKMSLHIKMINSSAAFIAKIKQLCTIFWDLSLLFFTQRKKNGAFICLLSIGDTTTDQRQGKFDQRQGKFDQGQGKFGKGQSTFTSWQVMQSIGHTTTYQRQVKFGKGQITLTWGQGIHEGPNLPILGNAILIN